MGRDERKAIMDKIDPRRFGFSPRTRLYKKNRDTYVIQILRKSRVVMKDAKALVDKQIVIVRQQPEAVLMLETSAPVCSKSTAYLKGHGIDVVKVD